MADEELKPPRLGEVLRTARETRGWTLAQVEIATRIPRRHLDALEANNLGALPAPVFTRGLVRSYAKHLGTSATEAEELLLKEEARQEVAGVVPTVRERPKLRGDGAFVRGALFLVLAAMIGVSVAYVLPRYRSLVSASPAELLASAIASPQPTAALTPGPIATNTPAPTSTPAPTVAPSATPVPPTATMSAEGRSTATAAAAIRGVTVEARALGRVWAQAEADGQVVFSGILSTAEKKTWRAERRILLHVGNAALVEVTHNGQVLGTLGPAGEVVKQEWTSSR